MIVGFEGFIFNDYVIKNGSTTPQYSGVFRAGLFVFIISFTLNAATAITAFLFGLFMKEGTYKEWFMTVVVGRATKIMATLGVILFTLEILLLFLSTLQLGDGYTIAIFFVTAVIVFVAIMATFLWTMIRGAGE